MVQTGGQAIGGRSMTGGAKAEEERASREATDWLILLQEEPEDADLRHRFQAWLTADPAHKAAWATTQRTADAIAATRPSGPGRTVVPDTRDRARRTRWTVAAAAAMAACLAILLVPDLAMHIQADHATATAETRVVDLTDGTRVVLAPESAIAVALQPDTRQVRLLAGEAFFQVSPDPDRPFRVDVRDVSATVLGTAFNIRREDGGASVALAEGRLEVAHTTARPPVSETLGPGQVVRVSWAGAVVRTERTPDDIAAWRAGRLVVNDETVAAVIDRLRPHYRGVILLADGDLAGRSVTGVYSLADPLAALRTIGQTHRAKVRRITPWMVVISGG